MTEGRTGPRLCAWAERPSGRIVTAAVLPTAALALFLNVLPTAQARLPPQETAGAFVIAESLDTPWGIAFLPDGSMLATERKGTVRLIDAAGRLRTEPAAVIDTARETGEGGLLGIALHPDFADNAIAYLYYTYSGPAGRTMNRVVRMTYSGGRLRDEEVILDAIPGASNHDGGRLKFGPDGFLYIGTGDAQQSSLAQDKTSLAGKILRVTDEGKPAPGNPFKNEVYSYGHRNVQGLAWDEKGSLFATEHGRSGFQSGLDEINRIEPGQNYGWSDIQGDERRQGMAAPLRHSGSATWAPSGAAFLNGSLFFGGLRGRALYEAVIRGNDVVEVKEHFKGEFGRIRDVVAGPDGRLYITTSNRDGRGDPGRDDDRIIRVDPGRL
jgi:glucose/arabinose dehydrogenase